MAQLPTIDFEVYTNKWVLRTWGLLTRPLFYFQNLDGRWRSRTALAFVGFTGEVILAVAMSYTICGQHSRLGLRAGLRKAVADWKAYSG